MSNWFIAFPIDAGSWHAAVVATVPPGLRAFAAEDLHATLAFLGPVGEERARAAFELARRSPPPAITATLGPVVPMGARRWSALSATSVEGDGALAAATLALRGPLLAAAGARADDREPKPHVTLARPSRKTTEPERTAALAWAAALDLGAPRLRIDRLALYGWADDRTQRLFRIVDSIVLPESAVSAAGSAAR